jgi:hypothetical protein
LEFKVWGYFFYLCSIVGFAGLNNKKAGGNKVTESSPAAHVFGKIAQIVFAFGCIQSEAGCP